MALESGSFINSLDAANPVATDGLAQADDHMRLLKATIKATFPSVTGAINATHTEINTATDGSTAATSTTIEDADRVVLNDDGTMVQAAMTDVTTYINASMTLRNDVVTASSIADSAVTAASIADNAITADKLAVGAAFVTGMVMPYAGFGSAPSGWEFCYGQSVDRAGTYANLYAAIEDRYGSESSSTFNLPDLRGRTIAGQDDMGGSSANRLTSNGNGTLNGDTLGAAGGSEAHALTEAELASHTHLLVESGQYNGGGWGLSSTLPIREGVPNDGPENWQYALKSGDTTADVGLSSATGSGTAHNNVQPTLILNYIIKT